jgi:hypothetical protein
MKKSKDSWHSGPFLKWWKTKQEKFHCGQFNEKEVAYSAWLAAIDYYVNSIEKKSLPYPSPTEDASMDDLYDDSDRPMDWRY